MTNPSFRIVRAAIAAAAFLTFVLPLAAQATMDLTEVGILWLHDRVDGVPSGNPYLFEVWADGAEIDSIQVTPPGGSAIDLTPGDSGEFDYLSLGHASFAALTTPFPGHATTPWRFDFFSVNGASEDDYLEIILNPSELTDYLDVLSPTHNGVMSLHPTVTWADCSSCGGNAIVVALMDSLYDDVDFFLTDDLSTTAWSPSASIIPGDPYGLAGMIGDYSHTAGYLGDPQWSSNGGDNFDFVAGFESINLIDVTAVPEPGTGLLVSLGLLGLSAIRRRAR